MQAIYDKELLEAKFAEEVAAAERQEDDAGVRLRCLTQVGRVFLVWFCAHMQLRS